ncbi:MAG: ATP-binding cassette domain-containing protein [Flavobacteriales bacterium]|nr:ATP-binding cassette domain-containing protein [Flavobacteriales bacterium]
MSDVVIKVENLSKQYRLGMVGAGTLREDLVGWWYRVRGKEDPYLKIGEANDRSSTGNSDYVWALRDIDFEVKKGEVLGIIGKNGAGKSTLLKLLSRVTAPTSGTIKAKGRIASLLEVGTGFHPELTGRENIYLNGAIMGMRKSEITSKFDEIVDFAGVQRYVDTPVKRYSSGMYVRLAFAVAAHLEPEILIVDEVLAVGDAEFQRKAIGKMEDVSNAEGRTVLFVSHNMKAVRSLCSRAILLENGQVTMNADSDDVVDRYLYTNYHSESKLVYEVPDVDNSSEAHLLSAKVISDTPITTESTIMLEAEVLFNAAVEFHMNIHVYSFERDHLFQASSKVLKSQKGDKVKVRFTIPPHLLNEKLHSITVTFVKNRSTTFKLIDNVLVFGISEDRNNLNWYGKTPGLLKPEIPSIVTKLK